MSKRATAIGFGVFVFLLAPGGLSARSGPDPTAPEAPDNVYVPPPCMGGVFTDVTCAGQFDAWIEQYAADHITGGCGGGLYCPNSPVTRAQMAVFVEKAMRGTDAWSPGDLGSFNTGLGRNALIGNTTGMHNTAVGGDAWALSPSTTGARFGLPTIRRSAGARFP